MSNDESELSELFAPAASSKLGPDVLGELLSILRIHSTSAQELSYKWESYTMRMGIDSTNVDLDNVRAFKKDLQEALERDSRAKASRSIDRKSHGTPRGGSDMLGMLDGQSPMTPLQSKSKTSSIKRKAPIGESAVAKASRQNGVGSPLTPSIKQEVNGSTVPFSQRKTAGDIVETLNGHLSAVEPPIAPSADARVKVTANTDLKKFYYKPMAMHLSEASEVLDDRIDEFQALVQAGHGLEDSAFGSAATQSTNEIVVVGRIACESSEGKLNAASIMLETSRRAGAGLRVPLNVDGVSKDFFPGQIVALRGINASGSYFSVREVLQIPPANTAVSPLEALDTHSDRVGDDALNVMVSAGPYTADDNLAFEPLNALCEKASDTFADALIFIGPFLDIEHPLLASGDLDLPEDANVEPDKATLNDVFKALVGVPLRRLAEQNPSITILMVPSVRDAVSKHVSWPQEPYDKKVLGLPKQARMVTNPVMISLNETLFAISAADILYDLRREEVNVGKPETTSLLERLPRHLIEQRHFFPIFPPGDRNFLPKTGTELGSATGMPLDTSYLKLGEWSSVKPDVLITPSALLPFGKVVDNVVVINPGVLSKRKGPGTYSQLAIHPRRISDEERQEGGAVSHDLFERTRIDIVKI